MAEWSSRRARAERERDLYPEHFEAVLENLQEGLVVSDLEGNLFHWNPAAREMHGATSPEECPRTLADMARIFTFSSDEEGVLPPERWPLARILRGETLRDVELTAQRSGCDWRRALRYGGALVRGKKGEPLLAVAVVSDVTERREQMEALRRSEALLRAVTENTPDCVFLKDAESRMLMCNPATLRTIGKPACEVIGRTDQEIYSDPAIGKALMQADRRVMDSGETEVLEEVVATPAGTRTFLSTKTPWRDANGKIIGLIGVARDITDRKRAEEQLRDSQRLESIGLLAGGVAHDFNNILTGVLGNASLALLDAPPDIRERLDAIVDAAERAAALTRQLLAYAGKAHFHIADFDLGNVLRSSAELIRASIPKNIDFVLDVPAGLPIAKGDAPQTQQMVMNLVLNASEAIGGQHPGTVTVRAGSAVITQDGPKPPGCDLAPGHYVFLEVRDTGCGMEEEVRARIFEPFFTTKFTGRGLGLAAVEGILRAHHGGISVRTAPGQGSTFTVFLPCAEPRPAAVDGGAWRGQEHAATVLVVDDEPAVLTLAKAALERQGHTVLLAANGQEAIEMCESKGPIDLVVLDVAMPVVSGGDALAEIRKRWPEMLVMVSSGYDRDDAMELGAAPEGIPFIGKPYTVQTLADAVRKALERAV